MDTTQDPSVAPSCSYCGRQNADKLHTCTGCGSPLVSAPPGHDSEPRKKSKVLAVLLALAFGPLGLFYASIEGALIVILIAVPFLLAGSGGDWLPIGVRIACAAWAFVALTRQDTKSVVCQDSHRLLNEAAVLEGTDMDRAISTYQEVIRLFPDTSASREAARNIQILTRSRR